VLSVNCRARNTLLVILTWLRVTTLFGPAAFTCLLPVLTCPTGLSNQSALQYHTPEGSCTSTPPPHNRQPSPLAPLRILPVFRALRSGRFKRPRSPVRPTPSARRRASGISDQIPRLLPSLTPWRLTSRKRKDYKCACAELSQIGGHRSRFHTQPGYRESSPLRTRPLARQLCYLWNTGSLARRLDSPSHQNTHTPHSLD
jgi:hypothetical protein